MTVDITERTVRSAGIGSAELADLIADTTAYVAGPGERWADRIERTREVPEALWTELSDRGYLSLAAPVEYGGRGVSFPQWIQLMEIFARSHGSLRMILHVVNGTWRAMDEFATPAQRARFVLPSIAGQIKVAVTLTEPGAGSGADVKSTVERSGDHYLLSGVKHMITFGMRCDYWLTTARLAGSNGHEGTVALMVPRDSAGVTVVDTSDTMGVTGTDHAHLTFDRTPVPIGNRLGAEGQGLAVAHGGFLTPSRISVAMSCVGLARRAQELAVNYARERTTFGKPLTARQAVQFMLAENETEIEAAKALVMRGASAWEDDDPAAPMLSSMAKLVAVDMLTRVTDRALQIHGGSGYWKTSAIERVYRDARAQRFEEGTNEAQKSVVFREMQARWKDAR